MKLPPGKRTGHSARVRFTSADGRPRQMTDRGIYLLSRGFLQQVIAGTGQDFEWQQTPGGPWHKIEATEEEAVAYLTEGEDKLGVGRRTVQRCLRIRERREAAGKPVCG